MSQNTHGKSLAAKGNAYRSYLKRIGFKDKKNVNFLLRQFPSLKMDDGYMMGIFLQGDRIGSRYRLYAFRSDAEDFWCPGDSEQVRVKKKDYKPIPWEMKEKRKAKEEESRKIPYNDKLRIDGMIPDKYASQVPDVFEYIRVPFTEEGAREAWLLYKTWYFLPMWWHANYNNSIFLFSPEDIEKVIDNLKKKVDRNYQTIKELMHFDKSKLKPSIRMIKAERKENAPDIDLFIDTDMDRAIVEFSYWNDWRGLVTKTEFILFDGDRVTFEDEDTIVHIPYGCGIML